MNIYWHDWVGYLGVILVLAAFFLLQARRLRGDGPIYQLMNIGGAVGVLISLSFSQDPTINWLALVMQLAWIAIGVFGIVYSLRLRRARRAGERESRTDGSVY